MSQKCKACGADNIDGAILCNFCSEPMEIDVVTVMPVALSSGSVFVGGVVRACALVENGQVAKREFELPDFDFEFLVGRTDIDAGIIPDVDLLNFGKKITKEGRTGYSFSRRQAIISRRLGRFYLKSLGEAKTLFCRKGGKWEKVEHDEEIEFGVGDRFRFGGTDGAVIFEVVA